MDRDHGAWGGEFVRCQPAVGAAKPVAQHDGRQISRLAIFGGAYGNVPALQACLRHAEELSCDGFVFLGDATGFCGHSEEVVDLIRDRCSILVAGNYEQKAAAGEDDCGCNYDDEEDNLVGSAAHQWAMRSLRAGNRTWLGTWPDLVLLDTPRGRIILCHGSPDQTNEFLYESQVDETKLVQWLETFAAVGLACTHSGFPWVRPLPGRRFAVNCGVTGKPDHDGDPAVHYAILDFTQAARTGVSIERVVYDHMALAAELSAEGVDEIFIGAIRTGIWACGLNSLPAQERNRVAPANANDC